MCKQRQDRKQNWEDESGSNDSIDLQDPGCCARCGDPLPVDGRCDCAGDLERDYVSGWRGLNPHALVVRLGPETKDGWHDGDRDSVAEVWI